MQQNTILENLQDIATEAATKAEAIKAEAATIRETANNLSVKTGKLKTAFVSAKAAAKANPTEANVKAATEAETVYNATKAEAETESAKADNLMQLFEAAKAEAINSKIAFESEQTITVTAFNTFKGLDQTIYLNGLSSLQFKTNKYFVSNLNAALETVINSNLYPTGKTVVKFSFETDNSIKLTFGANFSIESNVDSLTALRDLKNEAAKKVNQLFFDSYLVANTLFEAEAAKQIVSYHYAVKMLMLSFAKGSYILDLEKPICYFEAATAIQQHKEAFTETTKAAKAVFSNAKAAALINDAKKIQAEFRKEVKALSGNSNFTLLKIN